VKRRMNVQLPQTIPNVSERFACARPGTQILVTLVDQVSSGFVNFIRLRNLFFHFHTWLRGLYYDVK